MEPNAIRGEFQAQKEDAIGIQKARFEREMTEVLLNFREECLGLSQQRISFGQSLDESGGFKNPAPDLSSVALIQPDVSIGEVVVPQQIQIEDISVVTTLLPEIQSGKIDTLNISVPHEIKIDKVSVDTVKTYSMPTPLTPFSFKEIKGDYAVAGIQFSADAQKTINTNVPDRIGVSRVECTIENPRIADATLGKTIKFEIPRNVYKVQQIETACAPADYNILEGFSIKTLGTINKSDAFDQIHDIQSANVSIGEDLFKRIENITFKPNELRENAAQKEQAKNVRIEVPSVFVRKIQVQSQRIALPLKCKIDDVKFEKKSEVTIEYNLEIPQVPTIDWN